MIIKDMAVMMIIKTHGITILFIFLCLTLLLDRIGGAVLQQIGLIHSGLPVVQSTGHRGAHIEKRELAAKGTQACTTKLRG